MSGPTRRAFLRTGAALGVAAAWPARGFAQAETESHGLSTFGDLKYGPDFRRFDYAYTDAP